MENAKLLLDTGEGYLPGGKYYKGLCIIEGIIVTIIAIILLCCGEDAPKYMLLTGHYEFLNFIIGLAYLSLIIIPGIVFITFMALIVLGLGQIAKNTLPASEENNADKVPTTSYDKVNNTPIIKEAEVRRTPPVVNAGKWVCAHCQAENSMNYGQCKRCGKYRG